MTDDTATVNGRVTQRDLYNAISRIDVKLDTHYAAFDQRLRNVEHAVIEEKAHDDTQREMIEEQRVIRREQGVSRRWLAALVVSVVLAALASTTSFVIAIKAI